MTFDSEKLKQIVEAALLAAGKPLTLQRLGDLFEETEPRPGREEIKAALEDIATELKPRGFELVEVASGYRLQVKEELAPWVSRLWEEKPQRYSRALLETLALVAYRQPITRGEIEDVRGVAVSTNIIRTLLERDWVRVVGHREVPGKPAMYATTRIFLDYFNLKSLEELPSLAEIRDLDNINPELDFSDPAPEASILGLDRVQDEAEPSSDASESQSVEQPEAGAEAEEESEEVVEAAAEEKAAGEQQHQPLPSNVIELPIP
jgi:segregation and condensation protein B